MSAPTSPGSLTSPRKRALEIGTNPQGFESAPLDYVPQAGVPASMAGGLYQPQGPFVGGPGGSINTPTPFANLKK